MGRTSKTSLGDGIAMGALALVVAAASWFGSSRVHQVVYQYTAGEMYTSDMWFDADLPKMACLMSYRDTNRYRVTTEHPLVSTVTFLPVSLLRGVMGLDRFTAIRCTVAAASALWIVGLFLFLRLIGCRSLDSTVFAALAAASATGAFWTPVPESFLLGSLTILAPLALVARDVRDSATGVVLHTLASAASLALTVTNWSSGLIASVTQLPLRKAVQASMNALVIVAALWAVQLAWFPAARLFVGSPRANQMVHNLPSPEPVEAVRAVLFHSMVAPNIQLHSDVSWSGLTVQHSAIGSSGALGVVASVLWLALLGIGARQLVVGPPSSRFAWAIGGTLAIQIALHAVFGRETFLYAMHYTPLLVAIAACGALGNWRRAALSMAVALTLTAGINNQIQLSRAIGFIEAAGTEAAAHGARIPAVGECQ